MEDSAKRRERLQAMRMEASTSTERPSPYFSTTSTPLSNPLVSPVPSQESPPSSHRFDYYTDPTMAYSAAKRKTNGRGGDAGLGCYSHPLNSSSPIPSLSPAGQQMEYRAPPSSYTSHAHQVLSSNQSSHDARSQPGSLRSPVQYPSPSSGDRAAYAHQLPSPNQSSYHTPFPRPQTGLLRSPARHPSPASGDRRAHHNLPRPWNMSGNFSDHSFTPNSSNGGTSSSRHGEGRAGGAYSGMRGSPHSYSGGRGWQPRGRGGGYHNPDDILGRRQTKGFYMKSMVKDPWRKLKPVVGNILVPLSEPLPWLPKSIAPKKAKVAEASVDIKPKQNLAEFLALAFEESISNDQEGEGSKLPNPCGED